MPNISQIIATEVRRLAKKEVKVAMEPVLALLKTQKSIIIAQEKRIKALEKSKAIPISQSESANHDELKKENIAEEQRTIRLNQNGIKRIRLKLKLSQAQFATLLGVSQFAISHWELGKNSPREAQKRKIAAFRTISKREFQKLLTENNIILAETTKVEPDKE